MHYCDDCGIKRSYAPRNKTGLCRSCANKGKQISKAHKLAISKKLMGNTNHKAHTQESREQSVKNMLKTRGEWSDDKRKKVFEKIAATKLNMSVEEYTRTQPERQLRRRLAHNLRTQLYNFLKDKGQLRHVEWTINELKTHLEQQFTEGMSWDNYGRKRGIRCWEIDHVVPLNAKINGKYMFKSLSDPNSDDFKRAWALDNLQPMWADENNKKNNSYQE